MNDLPDVVVLSATRTAIGRYGGGVAGVPPCDLAAAVVREAVSRAGVEPADVGHAVFGNVIHTETRDMYLGRVAAEFGISREDQDALAVESHRRAAAAAQAGYFAEQITPIQAPAGKGTVEVVADEHIRPDATTDGMARLRPAFADDGTRRSRRRAWPSSASSACRRADQPERQRHLARAPGGGHGRHPGRQGPV